ncbi:fibrillarin-like rRNA/tRNA 2'-O-methyltransferase [Methanofollis aquaemaris]|uniref:Fibrillarin-like rRNA/tRNA 2'-O-methyltransferase n=1 Tax=Methanofollis aquaemaris TaxID=126734 RepID=A0A8A3S532_9EURY|nr:fibrillarin-like rRNA/tRNA 2'-O-methyltransferase [Methanofollis aquaemaris]QSZ67162.1 fibrillarin-like rRNA/tRNA 2'-O-methyltransferase [Methanofollis aquaemaris]
MIWLDGVLVSPGEGGVYGERMVGECRVWNPYRSKFAAYAMLGGTFDLTADLRVLYLGAANGTTVSHVADYVEVAYAVEFAPRPMQDLLEVCRHRKNIIPIMADAGRPAAYQGVVETVDLIYQDVAQPDQVRIALANLPFLRPGGTFILMLKTRSVDIRKSPKEVADETVRALEEGGLVVKEVKWLEPYHHDHAAIVCEALK